MQDRSQRSRKALFGGSFDPVHRGHLAMAAAVREATGLDSVVFLPCRVSPHKAGAHASPEDRLEMLRRALAEEKEAAFEVSPFELERPGPSYSWTTAEAMTRSEPEVDWHWIVGTDQWNALHRWAEPETLRRLLHFVVCTRGGESLAERPGWRRTVIPFRHPASSTAIRGAFEAHLDWLPDSVASYGRERGLYEAPPRG